MKEKMMHTIVGLVMNKKLRMAIKVLSTLMWVTEKGIDMYEGYAETLDHQILVRKEVNKAVKEEFKDEFTRVMRSNGVQEERIKEFLKSVS